jgi:hypothetical protein
MERSKSILSLLFLVIYITVINNTVVAQNFKVSSNHHFSEKNDGNIGNNDATYLMVYFPFLTHKFKIKTDVIPTSRLHIWWFDPQTGESFDKGVIENTGVFELP